MTSQVNQKVQLLVHHFTTRNDDIFLDNDPHVKMAEFFVKMTLNDRLFDERHIFSDVSDNQFHSKFQECLDRVRQGESDAESDLFDSIANHESYKYRLEIPYEDITKLIYEIENDVSSLELDQKFLGFEFALKNVTLEQGKADSRKIEKAYRKFKRHLKLAVAQKDYFQSITKQAKSSAELADTQSNHAKETARGAEKVALEAKDISKKAKDMSDGMVTNFVTILGIFATIIITVFGGINLIGSTVKLLEGNSRLSYLVFVVSFLMICLLTLIQMLTLWVSGLNSKSDSDSESNDKNEVKANRVRIGLCKRWMRFPLYTKSILVLSILILLSLMCISCLPQIEKASSENPKDVFRSETTTGININIDSKSKNDIPAPVVNTLQPVIDEMLDSDSKR